MLFRTTPREILHEQIDLVQKGGDPLALAYDPEDNQTIHVIVRQAGLLPDVDGVSWMYPMMFKTG